jgi:hypothetical protein
MYKNRKYTEWLNYETKFGEIVSQKCFKTGNRVKRRRKDSEFASRQWSKNNGLSSLNLSKSMNYESVKQQNDDYQFAYSNIFQAEDRHGSNEKRDNEFDLDDEYDNVSIPFECSLPNKELEAFLKDTIRNSIPEGTNETIDLH